MANTLIKRKILTEVVPATPADPGYPGSPATPARVTYETRDMRVEAPARMMSRFGDEWDTPLDVLRRMVNNPGLSATTAHYSDVWGAAEINGRTVRYPITWTSAWIIQRNQVKVYIPAQPAIPARPPTPATPSRRVYDLQLGWNAGAYSERELPVNWTGTATFKVGKSVGVVVGFSRTSSLQERRSSFQNVAYGLLFGDGVIRVRQAGVTLNPVATMTGSDTARAEVSAGRIDWYVNDQHVFRGPFAMGGAFVLDASLYAGEDAVDSPQLKDGVTGLEDEGALILAPLVVHGQVLAPLSFRLGLRPLEVFASQMAMAQAKARLRPVRAAGDPVQRGALKFKGLRARASDALHDAMGRPALAGLHSDVQIETGEGAWIPQYSIGNAAMAPPTVFGAVIGGQAHEYQLAMRSLMTVASQDAHAEGRLALAPAQATADLEGLTNLVRAMTLMGAEADAAASGYIVLVVSEKLRAGGELTLGAAGVRLAVREQVSSAAELQLTGTMVASVLEHLGAVERYRALVFRIVDGKPVLVDPGNAWVVNTESGASTRYEGFSFDSFMTIGGRTFGVRADGIYALGGTLDAGRPIEWGAALGKQDFGSQALKRLDSVYAGTSATGQLYVRIGDGCNTYTYRARRVDPAQRVQRFDPGRGLAANYFTFELVGEGAAELDNIVFGVVGSQRRTGGRY